MEIDQKINEFLFKRQVGVVVSSTLSLVLYYFLTLLDCTNVKNYIFFTVLIPRIFNPFFNVFAVKIDNLSLLLQVLIFFEKSIEQFS